MKCHLIKHNLWLIRLAVVFLSLFLGSPFLLNNDSIGFSCDGESPQKIVLNANLYTLS